MPIFYNREDCFQYDITEDFSLTNTGMDKHYLTAMIMVMTITEDNLASHLVWQVPAT
jgi:hypothetical protein